MKKKTGQDNKTGVVSKETRRKRGVSENEKENTSASFRMLKKKSGGVSEEASSRDDRRWWGGTSERFAYRANSSSGP